MDHPLLVVDVDLSLQHLVAEPKNLGRKDACGLLPELPGLLGGWRVATASENTTPTAILQTHEGINRPLLGTRRHR